MDCGQDMPADVSSPDLEGLLLLLLACGGEGGVVARCAVGRERELSGHFVSPGSQFFASGLVHVSLPSTASFFMQGCCPAVSP